MDNKRKFLEDYVALCRKYGLCFRSDDPYESIVLSYYDPISSNPDLALREYWIDCALVSSDEL